MSTGIYNVNYKPSQTVKRFHLCDAHVRGVRGPIGSGKSTACCFEIFRRAQQQEPSPVDGIRYSRWAVIRNTNPQLETTTIKTWKDWFPEHVFGKINMRVPYTHKIKFNDVDLEVIFLALDRPDDVKKLLSLELTGVWVNEAREVPIDIIRGCQDRVGRFPSKRNGGPTWYGVIMDTNPPDEDHWWAIYEGYSPFPQDWQKPRSWKHFVQPPAMFEEKVDGKSRWVLNPDADNLENLPEGYYQNVIDGKPNTYIRVYVGNRFGTTVEGMPIYGDEWNADVHIASDSLLWIPGRTLIVGLDFGRHPAACFSQQTPIGQWQDLHELVTHNIGISTFAKILYKECRIKFPDAKFQFWGDPAGGEPTQNDEKTCFDILRAEKMRVRPAPSQSWVIRREAGAAPLNRMVEGQPGYLCDPSCKNLIKGFNGRFRYPKINSSGGTRYGETPEKNDESHIHEARQYGYCGGGEARGLKEQKWRNEQQGRTFRAKTNFKVFG